MKEIERGIRRSRQIDCRDCLAGFPLKKWESVRYQLPGELSVRSISLVIASIGPGSQFIEGRFCVQEKDGGMDNGTNRNEIRRDFSS